MSASAGMFGGNSGGMADFIKNLLSGGQQAGTVVGQETPEWDFPYGADRIPDDVRSIFLRSDAGPTGLNEFIQQEMKKNPAIIDRLRSMINMGLMRPKNQAAQNITTGYGGYRAGDVTPLGPLINGMPSGLNDQQLNTLANIIGSGVQYNLGIIEQSGYLDGMPTLQRQKVMDELAQGWMTQATNQFLANETATHNRANEGLDQQKITNDNIQNMAKIFGGQTVTDPATGESHFQPTEEGRQFNTEQSGYLDGQATLTREQQAFNQAKDVANLASNPRNYIEAQMLADSRGGLNGTAPNNQVQQTTFGPPTTVQQPQFQAPGGQFNQMQNLSTMQQLQEQTAPGGQGAASQGLNTPTPQGQAATGGQYDLNNPATWGQMGAAAGGRWGNAQQGLQAIQNSPGFQSLLPQPGQLPSTVRPGTPPWPGLPNAGDGQAGIEPWMMGPDAANRRAALMAGQLPGGMGSPEPWRPGGLPNVTGPSGIDPNTRGADGVPFSNPFQPNQNPADQPMNAYYDWRQAGVQPAGQAGAQGAQDIMRYPNGAPPPQPTSFRDGAQVVGGAANPLEQRAGVQPAGQGGNIQDRMAQFRSLSGLKEIGQGGMAGLGGQPAQAGQAGQAGQVKSFRDTTVPTTNFTQSLLQNRVVPRSGGLATAGQNVSGAQIQDTFNPNKIRTQDYLRGEKSQQAGFNAVASGAGYSDEDLGSILQKNLPSFKAPTAGKMI